MAERAEAFIERETHEQTNPKEHLGETSSDGFSSPDATHCYGHPKKGKSLAIIAGTVGKCNWGEKKMSKKQIKQRKKTMGRSAKTLPYLREGHMRDSDEGARLLSEAKETTG